jgi:hypothetical protein
MANNIELVEKMLPLIDEVYRIEAKSSVLDVPNVLTQATGDAKTIKVAKITTSGLGDYDRETGFPEGDIDLEWETHTFGNERGRRFSLDRMDNIESFGLIAATMTNRFTRDHVIPEVDAYRFAKIATLGGTKIAANLAAGSAEDALQEGIVSLEELGIDASQLIIFATPRTVQKVENGIDRTVLNGEKGISRVITTYEDIPIVKVPQSRFYTAITLGEDGYTKSGDAKDINFIVMDKAASYNFTKLNVAKLFTPDENQKKDAWQWDFRLYHDTFVLDNKKAGIYVHTAA